MIKRSSKHNNKGFTLVEIVVAIAIIAMVVAAFVPLMSESYWNITKADADRARTLQANSGSVETSVATGADSGSVSYNSSASFPVKLISGGVTLFDSLVKGASAGLNRLRYFISASIGGGLSISLSPNRLKQCGIWRHGLYRFNVYSGR